MQQSLHYGFWSEWENLQKVTFDGPNRLMLVNYGVTNIDVEVDLYSDWKEWARLYDHGKYPQAMRSVGGDPTTAGRALGATFFLLNGWRVRTWEGDHRLVVDGNLFTEEGDSPFVPVTGPHTTIIESNVSNLVDRLTRLNDVALSQDLAPLAKSAELAALAKSTELADLATSEEISAVATAIEGIPTAVETANAVWATPQALLMELAAKILRNKSVTNPYTGQLVVFDDDGETPLLTANLFEDADETIPYRGRGAEVRGQLQ